MLADGVERKLWLLAGGNCPAGSDFTAAEFLASARAAFNLIVDGFAKGDRDLLRRLLSREVYQGFEAAIQEREREQLTSIAEIVALSGSPTVKSRLARAAPPLRSTSGHSRYGYQQADGNLAEAIAEPCSRWRPLDFRARAQQSRPQLGACSDRRRLLALTSG